MQQQTIGVPRPCGKCGSFQRTKRRKGPHLGEYCVCGHLLRWVPKEITLERALEFVLPFGKHKGKKLSEIDDDEYLHWLHEQSSNKKISELARLILLACVKPDQGGRV